MNLKVKQSIVWGSLLFEFIYLFLFTFYPEFVKSIHLSKAYVCYIIQVIIWLIQIFIGRFSKITSGISFSLLFLLPFWQILNYIGGYGVITVRPFINYLPIVAIILAFAFAVFEFIQNIRSNFKTTSIKESFKIKNITSILIVLVMPIFTFFMISVPNRIISYLDYGVLPQYFSETLFLYVCLPVIILLVLASVNVVYSYFQNLPKVRFILTLVFLTITVFTALLIFIIPQFIMLGLMSLFLIELIVVSMLQAPGLDNLIKISSNKKEPLD